MSVDVCFWKRGSGSVVELYESATEGIGDQFQSASEVVEFRNVLISRFPEIEDSLEPLAYDPELDDQEDLSRFILITLHSSQAGKLSSIAELARSFGLVGYDPQTEEEIS